MTDQGPEPSPPAGTVYGRGGVHVRKPRGGGFGGLHPGVAALVVGAGFVAVLALGYWAVRSPSSVPVRALPPPTPSPAATSAEPSPTPTPTPTPDRLGPGSWLISLADDPDTHLGTDGDFAAMSSGDPTVLTVLPGLADGSCFSFRAENGRYLRHFDFRLRFDAGEDAALFRDDATFCSDGDQSTGVIRLHSKNYPELLLHRRGTELHVDKPDGSDDFVADSSFAVQKPPNS